MHAAIDGQISDDSKEMASKLIEAICGALDEGADEEAVLQVVNTVVEQELEDAETVLSNAENIIGGITHG